MVFPISVLPTWLKDISYTLSLTWSLDGLRRAMLAGEGLGSMMNDVVILVILSAAYLIIGVLLTDYAFRMILKQGTVHMY